MPLLLTLAAIALGPAEGDAPPVWQGVWQGTVGALPVRVCLARRSEIYTIGSYYYRSKLRTIKLEQQGGSRDWLEGKGVSNGPPRPRWRFDAIAPGALWGRWSGNGGELPFRLTRVPVADAAEPCGSLAFNAPRLRPLAVTVTRATKDGVRFSKFVFDPGPAFDEIELETFALDGDDAATRRINARLRKGFTRVPADGAWFACVASGLDAHGVDGDFADAIEPALISPRWLAATESVGGYCGGAHPYSGTVPLTFDRRTGGEVDLADWLGPAAIERRRLGPGERPVAIVRPALRRLVLAQARDLDPECRATALDAEFWDIGLARAGLRFTPSLAHVEQGCEEETLVPWRVLAPFLSAAGRAGQASLR